MRCQECRDALRSFVHESGERADRADRADVARHLAECEACADLLDQESFWDPSILARLRREAPRELRESILTGSGSSSTVTSEHASLGALDWRQQLCFFWLAGTRDMTRRTWIEALAWVILVIAITFVLRWWRG
jgi:hypothetical protein